jgi:transcription initiation factor TFIID subunit 5
MSDQITPDFIAQAKYIIEQLQTRLETANADEEAGRPSTQTAFIDPSDRVEGYKRYCRWVSDGLDIWKVRCHMLAFFSHADIHPVRALRCLVPYLRSHVS